MRSITQLARTELRQLNLHLRTERRHLSSSKKLFWPSQAQTKAISWLAENGKVATSCRTFRCEGYIVDVLSFDSKDPKLSKFGNMIAVMRNPDGSQNKSHVVNMIWKATKAGTEVPAKIRRMIDLYRPQLPSWGFTPNIALLGEPVALSTPWAKNTRRFLDRGRSKQKKTTQLSSELLSMGIKRSMSPGAQIESSEFSGNISASKYSSEPHGELNTESEFFVSNTNLDSKNLDLIPFWEFGQEFKILQSQVWLSRYTKSSTFVCTRHYDSYTVDVFNFMGKQETCTLIPGNRIAIVRNLNDDSIGQIPERTPYYRAWHDQGDMTVEQMDGLLSSWLDQSEKELLKGNYAIASKKLRLEAPQNLPLKFRSEQEQGLKSQPSDTNYVISSSGLSKDSRLDQLFEKQGCLNVQRTCNKRFMKKKINVFTFIKPHPGGIEIRRSAVVKWTEKDNDYPEKALKTSWNIMSEGTADIHGFINNKIQSLMDEVATSPEAFGLKKAPKFVLKAQDERYRITKAQTKI